MIRRPKEKAEMSTALLSALILAPAAAVVIALFGIMWRERTSPRTGFVAIVAALLIAAWGTMTCAFAASGRYLPPADDTALPIGVQLVVSMVAMAICLAISPSLRSLLTNEKALLRLNLWRLLGVVFLLLMINGQAPALWALPAGIGDIIVGATAFPVASRLDTPGGRRLGVVFNLFGLADLVVAVGLGVATSPGPLHVIHTTPTTEVMTHFPMALVPGFLVPLAFMLQVVSLWQLSGKSLALRPRTAVSGVYSEN